MKKIATCTTLFPALMMLVVISCAPKAGMVDASAPASKMIADRHQRNAQEADEQMQLVRQQMAKADEYADLAEEYTGSLGTEDRLTDISMKIAAKVFNKLKGSGGDAKAEKIAVTVGVPLSDFKRETEFGRLLAEYILTDLTDRGLDVTELRIGKEVLILPQIGEFILSRNEGELLHQVPSFDYVVVSTFSNTRSTLIIQGRLISAKEGMVKTAWRYTMPLNREILGLFYDPQEIVPTTVKPFTMAVKGFGE